MAQQNKYKRLTASGAVIAGKGILSGMYVNSTSSGTVQLLDSLSGTGTIINQTITPDKGYHSLGNVECGTGCYAVIGATLDVTFHVKATD